MNQPEALNPPRGYEPIVNRNHQLRTIMDKIDRDLMYVHFAKRLNKISAKRKIK